MIIFVIAIACVLVLIHVCMQSAATPCTPAPPPARGYEFYLYPACPPPKDIKIEVVDVAEPAPVEPASAANDPDYFRELQLDELVEGYLYRIETVHTAHGRVKTNWRVMRFIGFQACGRKQGVLLHFGPRSSTTTTIANSAWCVHSRERFRINLMRADV
jgi:hypothetical protein